MPNATTPHSTATQRRVKYGLNVGLAVVVAIAIAAIVNVLAYKFFLFKDLTALGRYSLSQQTRQVLGNLKDDYTIATLMTTPDPVNQPHRAALVQQTSDLVDVYGRYSSRVTVQHFIVGRDATRIERFLATLESRYADRLDPVKAAIAEGRDALKNLHGEIGRQVELLRLILQDESLKNEQLLQFTNLLAQALARFNQEYDRLDQQIGELVDQPMPDVATTKLIVRDSLNEMKEKIFTRAVGQFENASRAPATPPTVKELLLQANTLFGRSIEAIDAAVRKLDDAQTVEEYDALRTKFSDSTQPDNILIIGPKRVQVVPLGELSPDLSMLSARESPELRFLGEERITGALISMGLEQPPLVVFVSGGQQPAIGPQGQFEFVAKRLRSVNFDVQSWNPMGQMMPSMGQMMPPGPPPQPAPGQKAVWIICPIGQDNPMNPMGGAAKESVAEHVKGRMDAGDSVLFMISVNFGTRFGATDPVADLLAPWGITPQVDRVVLREIMQADRQARVVAQFMIDQWPTGMPVTDALQGMNGIFMTPSPLLLGSGEMEGVTRYPLVKLEAQRMWTSDDLSGSKAPEYNKDTAGDSFLIGAAAEAAGKRIAVIADPIWATNEATTASRVRGAAGEDAVNIFGAAFPANAELFVNSVYWLANLEQLIAASPRSQDIRRIAAMSESTHAALQWSLLVGVPAAAFAAGIGMWLLRRRS